MLQHAITGCSPPAMLLLLFMSVCTAVGHFLRTLGLLPRIQGKGNIFYAGGWTFVDAHEFAIQGGLAAAHRLGAPYPFDTDSKAAEMFKVHLKTVHGM